MKRVAPLLILLAFVSVAAAQSSAWKPIHSQAGAFSFEMPGTPEEKTMSNAGMTLQMWQLAVGDSLYMVSFNDGPKDATGTPDEILDNMRKGTLAKQPRAKLVSEVKVTVSGQPARDLVVTQDGQIMYMRFILRDGKRLHMMLVGGDPALVSTAIRDRFFASFKLTAMGK
jgi:hypothetical protein